MLQNDEVAKSIGKHVLNLKVAGEQILSRPKVAPRVKSTVPTTTTAEATSPEVKSGEIPEVTTNALSGTAIADIKSVYKAQLRSRIEENKFYPMAARRMGQTGTVIVAFTLQGDGSIINIRIDNSSGNPSLDSAGLEAVKKVGKFKAIPSELNASSLDMSVPIKFSTH